MQLSRYKDYGHYCRSQLRTDRRKSPKPCITRGEVVDIAAWWRLQEIAEPTLGLCHGARYGQEIDWFNEEFPSADIRGTDMFPKGHEKIIKWDFQDPHPDLIGACDFVYSNCLDHSYDPVRCLSIWFDQLKPAGCLFIGWSRWMINVRGGDCFGAYFHEYLKLLDTMPMGEVCDVIYHYGTFLTIVCQRWENEDEDEPDIRDKEDPTDAGS